MGTELMGQIIGIIIGGLLGIPLYYWTEGMINRHETKVYIRECDKMMEKRNIEWERKRIIMEFKMELENDREYYESFLLGYQVDLIIGDSLVTYEITDPVALIIDLKIAKEDLMMLDKKKVIELVEEKMYDVKGNVKGARLNRIKVGNPVTKEDKKFLEGLGIPVEDLKD